MNELHLNQYDNIVEAIEALRKNGFIDDFNLNIRSLKIAGDPREYHYNDCQIVEYHRFEGDTDPSDMSIIYAIITNTGRKGLLIDAYGAYASEEMAHFFLESRVSSEAN